MKSMNENRKNQKFITCVLLGVVCIYPFIAMSIGATVAPILKLTLSTVLYYYVIKSCAITYQKYNSAIQFNYLSLRFLFFFFLWPGMNVNVLEKRKLNNSPENIPQILRYGFASQFLGLLFASILILTQPNKIVLSWLGVVPFLLFFHLGVSKVLFWLSIKLGMSTRDPFPNPFISQSLKDFWSNRWNQPFVEMNKCFFLPAYKNLFPNSRHVFLIIFILSGLLHEFAISFPVESGYGMPLVYFIIQAGVISVTEKMSLSHESERVILWTTLLVPLPLLFHAQFRSEFILGFYKLFQ